MAETTKRTIRENVSITAQLAKMSDKTIELIQENDDLREKERTNKQQIDILETNEKELSKKNSNNSKVMTIIVLLFTKGLLFYLYCMCMRTIPVV